MDGTGEFVGNSCGFGVAADAWVDRGFGQEVPDGIQLDLSGLAGVDFSVGGYFVVECIGPDGKRKWIDDCKNAVTDAGIASNLNVYFGAATQITEWFLELVDNAGWTVFSPSDTMTSHGGFSFVSTSAYSETTRPTWTPASASGGAVVNSSTVDFHMLLSLTIKGVALVSDDTKGGTTGVLFATAAFSGGTKSVGNGDTLKVTYTCGATSTS